MQFKKFSFSLSLTNLRGSTGSEAEVATVKPKVVPADFESNQPPTDDPYAVAGNEVLTSQVVPALWARATVEGNGTDGLTQAAYIRLRVAQLEAQAEESRRKSEEIARRELELKDLRVREIRAFSAQQDVSVEQAEEMLDHGICKENGKFILYLDDGRGRYAYDELHYAVQYSKQWRRHRIGPPRERAQGSRRRR